MVESLYSRSYRIIHDFRLYEAKRFGFEHHDVASRGSLYARPYSANMSCVIPALHQPADPVPRAAVALLVAAAR
jgi:hypothetical protein